MTTHNSVTITGKLHGKLHYGSEINHTTGWHYRSKVEFWLDISDEDWRQFVLVRYYGRQLPCDVRPGDVVNIIGSIFAPDVEDTHVLIIAGTINPVEGDHD